MTASGNLQLVIAISAAQVEDGGFLRHDLEMVRSALLYADKVELLSPAMMVGSVAALHDADADGWLEMLTQLDDDNLVGLGLDRDPAEFRELLVT